MNDFEQIKHRDKQFVMNTYSPYDIAFIHGEGSTLTDSTGKKYTDFLGAIAVNSLGYNSSIFTDALIEQTHKVVSISNIFYNPYRGLLAEKLIEGTSLDKVFFGNSGAEANECALKLARKYFHLRGENKYKFVSAIDSFHGRTIATVALTGQSKYNAPYIQLTNGFGNYVPFNDIDALDKALSDANVCALVIEPILGESGVIPATKEYILACREITRKNGQLLILDEVQTGAGRTGKFWAHQHFNIEADIVTTAKGIGGGVPIGACLASSDVSSAFSPGDHGTTFGSSPLVCATSYAVVSKIKELGFMSNVSEVGRYLVNSLESIKSSAFKEIRGLGLMVGVELDASITAKNVVKSMLTKGYILNACGNNALRFLPPLIISKAEIDSMTCALKSVMSSLA
ncbi:MAG: aspartate aminotransferase family protein [Christensenellaceae bacterium]|jgi:predicted acetylornithine/succinylornithine family transaminase|nr:aspartate aminotransferase family protein [Christensenellaceae bacterium]